MGSREEDKETMIPRFRRPKEHNIFGGHSCSPALQDTKCKVKPHMKLSRHSLRLEYLTVSSKKIFYVYRPIGER